jgi:hypothetical protein
MVPVLMPQPLPMPLEKWIEELERLDRAMEMIALLAGQDLKRRSPQQPPRRGSAPSEVLAGCSRKPHG